MRVRMSIAVAALCFVAPASAQITGVVFHEGNLGSYLVTEADSFFDEGSNGYDALVYLDFYREQSGQSLSYTVFCNPRTAVINNETGETTTIYKRGPRNSVERMRYDLFYTLCRDDPDYID